MGIIHIVLLFIMFYVQLYIGSKLKRCKFTININNLIVILSSSILYYYLLKFNYLNDYRIIITTIFLMIILAISLEKSILSLIQTTFFITLIMIFSESITAQFFINIININLNVLSTNKLLFVFFNIVIFITSIFIVNLKKALILLLIPKYRIKFNDFTANTVFTTNLMIIVIIIYLLAHKSFNKDTLVIVILSSIVCLILILIFFHKNYMLKVKQQELIHLKTYTSIIENLVDDVAKFKHDYNNILFMMQGYLEDNNVEELKKIFNEELIHECKNNEILKLKKIKDAGLKGLLTSKIVKLYSDNITLSIEVLDTIDTYDIDIIDLCRIVGILIDNAYEAAKDSKGKFVSISFIQDKDLNITIANSYNSSINININSIYKKSYSTKGKNRGIGLNNVKEIINKKYPNVLLKTSIEKDFFIQDLYIAAR